MVQVVAYDVNGKSIGTQILFQGPFALWRAKRWIKRQAPPLRPLVGYPPMWTYKIVES